MAVVSIQYKEGSKDLKYESVSISFLMGKESKTFKSGNFVKDWYDCNKFIILEELNEPVMFSSSIDHFIMDGAPYHSAYLNAANDDVKLEYEYNNENQGIEFFVDKDTKPTWNELRELCGDPKN